MHLERIRVENFRSITNSGWLDLDSVICLVGKNESGKTALLQAIRRLNPPRNVSAEYDLMEYPRPRLAQYKREHDEHPANVLTAEFTLSDTDYAAVVDEFGPDFLRSRTVSVTKGYNNVRRWSHRSSEAAALTHFKQTVAADNPELGTAIAKAKNIAEVRGILAEAPEEHEAAHTLGSHIKERYPSGFTAAFNKRLLRPRLPRFVYFSDYSILPGRVSIAELVRKAAADDLEDSDATVLGLLALGGAKPEDFQSEHDHQSLTAMLEAVSNEITDQVFKYWRQNSDLEVQIQVTEGEPSEPPPFDSGPILHFAIRNTRERWSLPFTDRSKGFVWFFSFLAYFSQFDEHHDQTVLLLDEPGLSLHASAQADFLEFIYDRLGTSNQVIYTTHSPFMIDAARLENARLVYCSEKKGTFVSDDVLKTDPETVFPLQAALGYTLAQSLFIGPDALLVEGPSDLLYLQLLSAACREKGLTELSDRWVVIPAGGADKLAYFVSLMGRNKINLAVLLDTAWDSPQRISALLSSKLISKRQLLHVSDFVQSNEADIEDILGQPLYLKLVNAAYKDELEGSPLTAQSLNKAVPRVTKRVEIALQKKLGPDFILNHYRPAVYLLRTQTKTTLRFTDESLAAAAELFTKINSLLR